MHQGSFINGRWVTSGSNRLEVISPIDDRCVFSTVFGDDHADQAIAARAAAPAWGRFVAGGSRNGASANSRWSLRAEEDAIAEAITREVGKPLWEARTEAGGLAPRIDLTCGLIARDVADWDLPENRGCGRYLPLGVVSVLGPFNFPAHLANGQILPALLLGNTVILKPSEKEQVAALYSEAIAAAELPPGVFNMVQGDAPASSSRLTCVSTASCSPARRAGKMILAATHQTLPNSSASRWVERMQRLLAKTPTSSWPQRSCSTPRSLPAVSAALRRAKPMCTDRARRACAAAQKGGPQITCRSPAQRPCLYGADHRPASESAAACAQRAGAISRC